MEFHTLVNGLSGIAYVLFGLWVLHVGRGKVGIPAFVLFAVGLGVSVAGENFLAPYNLNSGLLWTSVRDVTRGVAALAVVAVAVQFPVPLGRDERRLAWYAAVPPAAVTAYSVATATTLVGITSGLYLACAWGAVLLLALRHRHHAANEAVRRSIVVLAAAIAIFPAVATVNPFFFLGVAGDPLHAWLLLPLALMMIAVAAWLANATTHDRAPRNVAWLILATGLAAAVVPTFIERQSGLWGISRTVGLAILAYAILQHRLLGLDVKVRWTISKSTIAAVFIAVFFIASEAAQQFFGATFNSAYVGIGAAGMLVFAIAPLQRAAERIAEKAVPVQGADSPTPPSAIDKEAIYRDAVRAALADRALSRDDEHRLLRLAEALGLPTSRALELTRVVEKEEGVESSR